jgi:hypothetical protein
VYSPLDPLEVPAGDRSVECFRVADDVGAPAKPATGMARVGGDSIAGTNTQGTHRPEGSQQKPQGHDPVIIGHRGGIRKRSIVTYIGTYRGSSHDGPGSFRTHARTRRGVGCVLECADVDGTLSRASEQLALTARVRSVLLRQAQPILK